MITDGSLRGPLSARPEKAEHGMSNTDVHSGQVLGGGEASSDAGYSLQDVLGELSRERRARLDAAAEAREQRRLATAFQQLFRSVVSEGDDAELLRPLLDIFAEVARADAAVIRLREGDRLRSRAARGLDEEVLAGFSLPVAEGFPGYPAADHGAVIACAPGDGACRSDFMRDKGVHTLYCLPLRKDAEIVGVIYLGALREHQLAKEETHLLESLIMPATAAVARRARHDALQRSIDSRDQVLAVVAHDLRTPVNVVSLAANGLLKRLADSTAKRAVERILRAAHRADRLIQDLLDVSAIEAGHFSVERRQVEAADVILAAVESQQSRAAEASVILATDVSPDLPSILADEERLLEALENVVGNAIKFTKPGGLVTVGATHRSNEILVWVKDNGAGIAPEQLPHLFDRFWQARKGDRRGTGLGLTICKAIVEAHGGQIWIESKLGAGTEVFFTVPVFLSDALKPILQEVSNILLVDDRPENLVSLTALLARSDYRLITAQSGEEALSVARHEHFAVALIDVAMPGMTGLEVAGRLKDLERNRDTPVIFVTGYGDDPGEIHRAYAAGGADYLVKPLDPEIVRRKVAVFVELGRKVHRREHRPGGHERAGRR